MEQGLTWRARDSNITRWTMYILAKIAQALMDDSLWEHYLGWVVRFHREIVGSPASPELSVGDLCARLSGLHDVSNLSFHCTRTYFFRLF